jgi:glycosyltransferase involved in cell wall biosynthesis
VGRRESQEIKRKRDSEFRIVKILHTISSSGMYGAEAVILNLSHELNRAGHESIIGVFQHRGETVHQLSDAAISEGIASYSIPCRGQIDLSAARRIRDLVQTLGVDVVHAHGYKADIYTWIAMRGLRVPLVSTCHNWLDTNISTSVYGWIDRRVLRNFSDIVAVSENVRKKLLDSGVSARKVRIIRNGIDVGKFRTNRAWTEDAHAPLIVGLAGRLSVEKGVDIFLRVAAGVRHTFPEVRFVIVGEGPERATLEQIIKGLDLEELVSMPGRCNDMRSFYHSLDVLVSSSRMEGLPMGLLEAMASGLPVIATDVGDVSKIVHDGETGILVPSEDEEALEEAIIGVLRNISLRQSLGKEAAAFIEKEFSAASMTAQYLKIYEAAIEQKNLLLTRSHRRRT